MSHYFNPDPELPHAIARISFVLKGVRLYFTTDAGVFSRQRVDAGSGFLLESLPPLSGRVLDLGSGYGPIGIGLAALNPAAQVTLADINRRAAALAAANIKANGLKNAVAVVSDGFAQLSGTFSHIVSNPPIRAGNRVVYSLYHESREYLEPGGSLWLVVRKKQGAPSTAATLESIFANCSVVKKAKGYWLLHSVKH